MNANNKFEEVLIKEEPKDDEKQIKAEEEIKGDFEIEKLKVEENQEPVGLTSMSKSKGFECGNNETKWFQCEQCDHKTKRRHSLKVHVAGQHSNDDIKWFECEKCSFKTKQKYNLRLHTISKHLTKEEIKWFKCEKCDYKSKLPRNLKAHVTYKHLNEENWLNCDKCDYKTKQKGKLKLHVTNKPLNKNESKWFEYGKCCVPGCSDNYKTGEKVHIFSFPVVDDLRKKWLQAIKLEDFHPTKNTKVCASHFTADDILWEYEYFDEATGRNLSFRLKYPRLRNDAIPTQFLDFPSCPSKTRKSRKKKLLLAEDDFRAHEAKDFGLRCRMPKPKTRKRTLTEREPAANTRKTQPVTAKKQKIAALCVDPTVEVPDDGSSVETAAAPFLKHVLANEGATVGRVEFVKEEEIDVKEEPLDKRIIKFDIKAEPADKKNFVLPEIGVQCELGVETFRRARFKIEHQLVSASCIASHVKVEQEEIQIKEEILSSLHIL